ncbi:MAG TPA: DUF2784 domain-containing protein [Candidatus Acidoferrales bacterium]|nr:DUF2784 domain-containing protein [Candidatus Acidoferrales bacterium]
MRIYHVLAVVAFTLHAAWILWVLLGWLATRKRPVLRWLHIGSVVYAILIEVVLFPCPLTLLENWSLQRAGEKPYEESFLIHYFESVIYPDVSQQLLTVVAVMVCVAILGVHLLRYARGRNGAW